MLVEIRHINIHLYIYTVPPPHPLYTDTLAALQVSFCLRVVVNASYCSLHYSPNRFAVKLVWLFFLSDMTELHFSGCRIHANMWQMWWFSQLQSELFPIVDHVIECCNTSDCCNASNLFPVWRIHTLFLFSPLLSKPIKQYNTVIKVLKQ